MVVAKRIVVVNSDFGIGTLKKKVSNEDIIVVLNVNMGGTVIAVTKNEKVNPSVGNVEQKKINKNLKNF